MLVPWRYIAWSTEYGVQYIQSTTSHSILRTPCSLPTHCESPSTNPPPWFRRERPDILLLSSPSSPCPTLQQTQGKGSRASHAYSRSRNTQQIPIYDNKRTSDTMVSRKPSPTPLRGPLPQADHNAGLGSAEADGHSLPHDPSAAH